MGPIVFDHVEKRYGSRAALRGLSATFPSGQVTALLGPNGAGKTTAVSILLGLSKATKGTVRVGELEAGDRRLRERIGAMLQESPIADGLQVREMLQMFREYYHSPLPLDQLLLISGLEQKANRRTSALSGGEKRRLAFALAMAGNPDIIVLDEPTTGMDVESRVRFWEVIKAYASQGKTILLTTHYLEEADAVADHIAVIAEGRLIAEGTPQSLKARMPVRKITFRLTGEEISDQKLLALPGVREVRKNGNQVELFSEDTDQLLPLLLQSGIQLTDIQVHAARLEDVFQQLTRSFAESGGISR
jgi:ABC-2 type transport system ATP-binding protein